MRPRLNLWLKKRGGRRTGSQGWATSGEVLYHAVFVGVGVVAAWLHVTNVLLPEWRRRDRLASFEAAQCVILERQIETRRGVGESDEYQPRCLVQVERDGELGPPVWATAGDRTTSRRRAEARRDRWIADTTVDCWFDPDDPRDVVLTRKGAGWPGLVLLMPVSLAVVGVVGIVRAVLRGGTSDELRRVLTQAALAERDADNPIRPPAVSGLPPADTVGDSPGVTLRYRLPLESQDGWRLAGMFIICVMWNALVGFFLFGVIYDHLTGTPDWALTLVVTPLAVAGGWLAYQMLRDAQGVSGVGATRVELSDHPLRPGGEYRGAVTQTGQFTARKLSVALVCQEVAIYRQGTDARRFTEDVYRDVLLREVSVPVDPAKPFETEFAFTIPAAAMHSLQTPNNEVRWSLEVVGVPTRWPVFRRRFRLCVYPAGWPTGDHGGEPMTGESSSKTAAVAAAEAPT